jgi:hypothetical protein
MDDLDIVSAGYRCIELSAPSFIKGLFQRPATYTIGNPIFTIMGAATTIVAPMILHPAAFITFSLAMVVFQYLGDFDLGLNRLIDRRFAVVSDVVGTPSTDLIGDITVARCAISLGVCAVVLCLSPVIGVLYTLAGIGGTCFMLTVGPIAFNRARSNIYVFTIIAFINSIGMIIPRLVGLLLGGVEGCILALVMWYAGTAVSFNFPYLRAIRRMPSAVVIYGLYAAALPLFAYGNLWSFYLLTSRWFSASLTTADQAGLFAFGANLIWIGVGVISAGAQVYYPRHLMLRNQRALLNQMFVLLALASLGIMVAIVLCRFELSAMFPKFAAADRSTAMILISGIPICLIAWVLPIIIATAERPWVEALIVLGGSIVVLLGCMWLGDDRDGIVGQAVGCTFSAGTLLATMLFLMHKHKMLHLRRASILLASTTLAMALCYAEWQYLFGCAML